MAEIKVNVTATKSKSVTVSSGNVQNVITASADTTKYYSEQAKAWAISESIVNNEDYSSKHYSKQAKTDAERATIYARACQETYNNLVDYSVEAMDNIEVTKNSAISDISETGHKAVTDIETEKQNTITEIQDITINNKEEIKKLSNQEQNKIVSLGIDTRANVDLSNLSATGEKHFLNKSQITNCILEAPNGVATYSGSTITVASGVKVLIPNGRNPDGTLNNIEYTTKSELSCVSEATGVNMFGVIDAEWNQIWDGYAVIESETQPSDSSIYTLWYQPSTNLMKWHTATDSGWTVVKVAVFANFDRTQGVVSNFNAKEPFRAMEYMPLTEAHVVVETYHYGASWYRVYSDGWCEQGGYPSVSNNGTITFLKPFKDINYTITLGNYAEGSYYCGFNNKATTGFNVYSSYSPIYLQWRACGYIY